jgi:hypothetical protein
MTREEKEGAWKQVRTPKKGGSERERKKKVPTSHTHLVVGSSLLLSSPQKRRGGRKQKVGTASGDAVLAAALPSKTNDRANHNGVAIL